MSKEQLYDKDGNPVYIENKKKKGGCLKWLLIGLLVIIVLGSCGALPGGNDEDSGKEENTSSEQNSDDKSETSNNEATEENDDSEEAPKELYEIGETFEHDGIKVTVNETERLDGGDMDLLDEGDNYIRINLTINNDSDKEVSYNPLNFEIQTSDGNIKDSFDFPPSGSEKVMTSGKLAEGGSYTANLFYEVPADDNDLILRYEPSFWGSEIIKFNVNN